MNPLIVVDISNNFNIPEEKKDIIYDEFYNVFNDCLGITSDDYDKMFLYKEPINKKRLVIESENAYNAIVDTVERIKYLRDTKYRNDDYIVLLFLGRYSEYRFVQNILNNYSNRTNNNFIVVRMKPMHHYLANYGKFKETIEKDISKIKKEIEEQKKCH